MNTPAVMSAPTVGALFAGYDGIGLAVERVLGAQPAWFSEYDPASKVQAPSKVLAHHWPDVPNHGDITAIDWAAVEPVDIITGGFPCQDLSLAGGRAGMTEGTRSGLWSHMATAINAIRPPMVIAENVRGLLSAKAHSAHEYCDGCMAGGPGGHVRALGVVLSDLAQLGYDAQWIGIRASDVGAPHQRFRVFVVAHLANSYSFGPSDRPRRGSGLTPADTDDRAGDGQRTRPQPGQGGQDPGGRHVGITHDGGERLLQQASIVADAGREYGERRPGAIGRIPCERQTSGQPERPTAIDWGIYAPAVARWERLTRPAPRPTETGPHGGQRLSPAFVEWMQGLPEGHVTDPAIGLTDRQQLRVLGNGVVPQQAEAAIRHLLTISEES